MNARATRPLSRDDLLTVEQAARELGCARDRARAWLALAGLLREVPAIGIRVVWGDVLDAIRGSTGSPSATPVRRLPRRTG